MIEIVFSDSAAGGLKVAMNYGRGNPGCIGIGVSVLCADGGELTKEEIEDARREAEERERLAWERAVPIGGNLADVFGFNLALSVGDISKSRPDTRRQLVLERLFCLYPEHGGRQAAQKLMQRATDNLDMVLDRAGKREPLRLWYSNQPDDLCGLYWFMAVLDELGSSIGPINLIRLPEWEADGNGNIIRMAGWGEIAPGDWHRYLVWQRMAPRVFCQGCAAHWRTLQKENAPLRAVLNGQLVSMPEALYDDFIMREIAAETETFHEARLIGRIIGKYQLGIGDGWIALRIEEMLRAGQLEAVTAAPIDGPIYHRMLKKRH